MAEAIKTSLPFVVDELFSVSTVDVLRSVSADKLKSALQWLVEGVQRLQGDHTVLRQDLAELSHQGAVEAAGVEVEPSGRSELQPVEQQTVCKIDRIQPTCSNPDNRIA